jgi:hypothetical protein
MKVTEYQVNWYSEVNEMFKEEKINIFILVSLLTQLSQKSKSMTQGIGELVDEIMKHNKDNEKIKNIFHFFYSRYESCCESNELANEKLL